MKTFKIILGILAAWGFGPTACNKAEEPAVQHQEPITIVTEPNKDIPQKEEKKTEKLPTADMLALESLGLKPLEIDATALPPLPEADDPSDNIGLDAAYLRWDEFYKRINANQDPNNPLIGADEGWRKTSKYIIWGYGRPTGIVLGRRTLISDMNTDTPMKYRNWHDKPYIPLTLKYGEEQFLDEYYTYRNDRIAGLRFDSLTRLHGVVPGNWALHQSTPMPYDLRHMRIAHNGVDISPLFSIRYQDYKEVTRTRDYSKWYWRDVRVSDVGMDVLDWLFDGYFHIYPLTKDYPRFTIIFILEDGTILSREVEHRV
ncbi:MAG: hypothetical protein Q4A61_01330 [Porphyromonadaceae bacterium]|nr:hypothetical protein [Porphyromonadaceae bacterium]